MKLIKRILEMTNAWPVRFLYEGVGTILALHRVVPFAERDRIRNAGLEITPNKLEFLIDFFKVKDYDFLSIDELAERLKSKARRKFLILTFDDGYADNYEIAYPILQSAGVPFTIYLTNNFIQQKQVIWWYALEALLLSTSELKIQIDGHEQVYEIKSMEQKKEIFNEFRNMFISRTGSRLTDLSDALFGKSNTNELQKHAPKMLQLNQISELVNDKSVTIGAHTFSHPALNILNKEEFIYEVEASKNELESIIREKIRHFSYPFGTKHEVGPRDFQWVKELGFESAVTGRPGNLQRAHIHHMTALPRLYVSEQTTAYEIDKFITGVTPCLTGFRKRVMVD